MNRISYYSLGALLMIQAGCASMKSMVGQSTFQPASYGSAALVGVIRDPSSTRMDALVAARELRNRSIASIPEEHFIDIITNRTLQTDARAEVLDLLTSKSLPQFKEAYRTTALGDPQDRVAELAGVAFFEWAEEGAEKETFLLAVLNDSPHAVMRTRAAIALRNLGPQYIEDLLRQLSKETSASAAYAICEALADYRTDDAVTALEEIANNVERKFNEDAFLADGRKINSDAVRAFCVAALESMSSQPY